MNLIGLTCGPVEKPLEKMNGRLLKVSFIGFVSPVLQLELCHLLLLQLININIISGHIVFVMYTSFV